MNKTILAASLLFLSFHAYSQCNGVIFKNTNGKLEKYTNSGSYQGSVTSEVSEFDCNNELVVVVKNNGRVEKYSFTGSYQGSITDEAIKVRINGNQLIITKKNGRMEKYSFSGSYQGSI